MTRQAPGVCYMDMQLQHSSSAEKVEMRLNPSLGHRLLVVNATGGLIEEMGPSTRAGVYRKISYLWTRDTNRLFDSHLLQTRGEVAQERRATSPYIVGIIKRNTKGLC